MFKKKTLLSYEEQLLQGDAFLVINRLNGKYTTYDSIEESTDRILVFNVTHPHVDIKRDSNYQRYEKSVLFGYRKAKEGMEYYLVLQPNKKRPELMDVIDYFPCGTTELPSSLVAVLSRDAARTGFHRSLDEEREEAYNKMVSAFEEMLRESETPEQYKERKKRQAQNEVFSLVTNKILTILGCCVLVPAVLIGSFIITLSPLIGLVVMMAGILLFLFVTIVMIIFKKPIIKWKRRQLGMDEETTE